MTLNCACNPTDLLVLDSLQTPASSYQTKTNACLLHISESFAVGWCDGISIIGRLQNAAIYQSAQFFQARPSQCDSVSYDKRAIADKDLQNRARGIVSFATRLDISNEFKNRMLLIWNEGMKPEMAKHCIDPHGGNLGKTVQQRYNALYAGERMPSTGKPERACAA